MSVPGVWRPIGQKGHISLTSGAWSGRRAFGCTVPADGLSWCRPGRHPCVCLHCTVYHADRQDARGKRPEEKVGRLKGPQMTALSRMGLQQVPLALWPIIVGFIPVRDQVKLPLVAR